MNVIKNDSFDYAESFQLEEDEPRRFAWKLVLCVSLALWCLILAGVAAVAGWLS